MYKFKSMFKQYIIELGLKALVSVLDADTSNMKPKKAKTIKDIKTFLVSEKMQQTVKDINFSYLRVVEEIEDSE